MDIKYPDVEVELSSVDGNAHSIVAAVLVGLLQHDVPASEMLSFEHEALSGDYDHVIQTAMNWVNVH